MVRRSDLSRQFHNFLRIFCDFQYRMQNRRSCILVASFLAVQLTPYLIKWLRRALRTRRREPSLHWLTELHWVRARVAYTINAYRQPFLRLNGKVPSALRLWALLSELAPGFRAPSGRFWSLNNLLGVVRCSEFSRKILALKIFSEFSPGRDGGTSLAGFGALWLRVWVRLRVHAFGLHIFLGVDGGSEHGKSSCPMPTWGSCVPGQF